MNKRTSEQKTIDNYSKPLERQQCEVIKSIDSEIQLPRFKSQLREFLSV